VPQTSLKIPVKKSVVRTKTQKEMEKKRKGSCKEKKTQENLLKRNNGKLKEK